MSNSNQRRRYFIDPAIQGALLQQALLYWMWATGTFIFIIFIYRVAPPWVTGKAIETGRVWYHLAPYVVASAVLFPVVVLRAIRFSHRFCGPMVPIRRALKALADGDTPPQPIRLRRTDYWKDVADDINAVIAKLEQAKSVAGVEANAEVAETMETIQDETRLAESVVPAACCERTANCRDVAPDSQSAV